MLAFRLHQKNTSTPVLVPCNPAVSIASTKDGITVSFVETEPAHVLHTVENVFRVDVVDLDTLCTSCRVYDAKNEGLCHRCLHKKALANPISVNTRQSATGAMVYYDCVYPGDVPLETIRQAWFSQYHPGGYSTQVSATRFDSETGHQHVVVSRFSSCD